MMNHGNSGDGQQLPEGNKDVVETNQEKKASNFLDWGKFLAALVTGLGALIYAIGYLCHLGHHKMLGISHIEYPNDQIIFDGVCFFILTPLCVFLAFCISWLPWIISLLLLVIFFSPPIITSLFHKKPNLNHYILRILKIVTIILVVFLHFVLFFIASIVIPQKDLLLSSQNQRFPINPAKILFAAISSHCPQLSYLLESGRSRSLYGLLFFSAVICSGWWIRYIFKSFYQQKPLSDISTIKVVVKRGFIVLGFYFLLLFTVLSFCLYGYLVKSNKYPVIEFQLSEAKPFPEETVYVLGDSGSKILLYSPQKGKERIWWVENSAYLPASRSKPPESIFKTGEPQELNKNGNNTSTKK